MQRFALNKITHHQTIMPEIFEYLSYKEELSLLCGCSKSSRQFVIRNYYLLSFTSDNVRHLIRKLAEP